jgi:Na+/melibiose symporter-like transporter
MKVVLVKLFYLSVMLGVTELDAETSYFRFQHIIIFHACFIYILHTYLVLKSIYLVGSFLLLVSHLLALQATKPHKEEAAAAHH